VKCSTCGERIELIGNGALIPNGWLLYDSVNDCDVEDADACPRFNCPHDMQPVYYSRMLPGLGSLGEEARGYHEPFDERPF